MALDLTLAAQQALDQVNIEPQLVLKIDGVDTIYSAVPVEKKIKIGDPGLLIGGGWVIGGSTEVENQNDLISLKDGTSTSIRQQLNPDQGLGSSISSMQVALVDKGEEITRLITPGEVVDDILARRAKVYLGFRGTNFPDDFVIVFRGIIDDIDAGPGKIVLNIAHPDQKKRQEIFKKAETNLAGSINNSVTTITVDSTTPFLEKVLGPDGTYDSSILFYVRIDDEVIQYDGISGNDFTGCTRGALGTTAASHGDDSPVSSFYVLTGNAMDLARKLMLSGWNDYYVEDLEVESFNVISATETVANAIFFKNIDLVQEHNIQVGDFITTVDATDGDNNETLKEILSITSTDTGTYVEVDGVVFVDESDSPATASFRSKWDTLGEGLAMHPEEVDLDEHERLYRLFLSSHNYLFYLKDTINGKEFIEQEVYKPAAAYSIPRKAQASVGYHIGPIPGTETVKLSTHNIVNPKELRVRRCTAKHFYNTVIYEFEDDVLEDKFLFSDWDVDVDSKARIKYGSKALVIKSKGMRQNLQGVSLADTATTRLLNRYKFGAEFIERIRIFLKYGFKIEIGDIVMFDAANLSLPNTDSGDRTSENIRLYEVINKDLDIANAVVNLTLVNTNFSTAARYGLISPASLIKTGVSTTQFVIEESFASVYGADEYRKWDRFELPGIKVRNDDFSNNSTSVITGISGNLITVSPALSFTPSAGDILEFANYDDCTTEQKLIYAFMSDATFGDGRSQYEQL